MVRLQREQISMICCNLKEQFWIVKLSTLENGSSIPYNKEKSWSVKTLQQLFKYKKLQILIIYIYIMVGNNGNEPDNMKKIEKQSNPKVMDLL